ncbi:unnamed protein product, partial [Mesorhabditis belari]|uniref:Uncharacterized protein n=1 Tax=Mesorhabditis belari TaxID=2138241 RepID=A0AAF3F3U3_9BILA
MPIEPNDVPRLPEAGATQKPSDTADHQRFDEMLVHLTPLGCTVPYNAVYDSNGNIWVAGKGGLFKICGQRNHLLWSQKNDFPKRQAAYSQVIIHKDSIVYTMADDNSKLTEFRILDLNGEKKHEQFIDGLVQSLVISPNGTMYISKQLQGEDSIVFKTSFDSPLGWEELCSDDEMAFQALCIYDDSLLIAACAQIPVNMYSKQCLKWINADSGKVIKKVSTEGKNDGEIFFPRKMHRSQDDILLVDKTGRFIKFDKNGQFLENSAQVDAYLVNGFCLRGNEEATIVCSGVVQDEQKRTLCDDWLEEIRVDGKSKWRKK